MAGGWSLMYWTECSRQPGVAADDGAYPREPNRRPGQPSLLPERLVPAEQARVGSGREEFYSTSRPLSQGTAVARMLNSCLLAIRSLSVLRHLKF